MRDWPHEDGEEFYNAVKTCLDVMTGRSTPAELRNAMLRAAGEAGIIVIASLH